MREQTPVKDDEVLTMNRVELASEFFRAIEQGHWHEVSLLLTDDFAYYGPTPEPYGKEEWLHMQEALNHAFPDWSFHLSKVEQELDKVVVTVHITGTHDGPLKLPIMGLAPLPPTHQKITLPEEHATLTFRGDQISELHTETTLHGGLLGLLTQLGLE